MKRGLVFGSILIALAVGGLFILKMEPASTAQAGLFSDVVEAVAGHVEDAKERITHDDEFIEGVSVASGEFRTDDPGRDSIHWADGSVSVVVNQYGTFVQLRSDFRSGPAPDLYIYTASSKVVDEESFYNAENLVELGTLQSGSGASYYYVGQADGLTEVIIWCKKFGEYIGAATVK